MQVEAAIDEADISRVRDGQKVSFTIDAFPGRSFEGAVRQVRKAAVSAQNVVSYTVVVGFANPGSLMLPGMTANVRIITDTRDNVLKVPNAALRVRIAGIEPEGPASAVRSSAAPGFSLWPEARAQGAQGTPGRLGAMRERLVEGLQLDAEQQAQLDAVLAEMRADFMALGGFPEAQRAAAREQLMNTLRQRINAFLTPAQRQAYAQLQSQAVAARASQPAASAAAPRANDPPAAAKAAPPAAATNSAAPQSAVPPELPASGPLVDFRRRLIDELGLTPAQTAQVDAILAAQRPRFAELRSVPENQRGKARDRILADMRALIGQQLTPEQQPRYQKLLIELAGRQTTRGRIYLLAEGGKPRAFNVRLGISDGVMTELIVPPGSPDAAVLVEGASVITAVVQPASSTPRPPAGPPAPGPRLF
jgi:Spy/CpxP family protein refolding chaperone